jgi:hypothetical protein
MQPAASPPDKVKKDKVPTPPTASLEFINKKEQLLVDSEKLFDKIAGSRGIATTLAQCRVDISRAVKGDASGCDDADDDDGEGISAPTRWAEIPSEEHDDDDDE